MSKIFAVQSNMNPEIGFAVEVGDGDYEKAKSLVEEGFVAWTHLGDNPKELHTEHFGPDAYKWIYNSGWSEPSTFLLGMYMIPYTIFECFDDNGEWIDGWDKKVEEVL